LATFGIGLDIGTSAVKLVELQGGKTPRVSRLRTTPLRSGTLNGGEILDRTEVSEAIKNLIQSHNIQSKRMVIAVAGQAVTVRLLKIVLQNKKELADTVRREAERNLPYSMDELYMDFQIIREDHIRKEMEIVLVAARKSVIDSQLEVVRNAGVEPLAIDIQPLALVRAAGYENTETLGNIGLLDIGEETSDLIIIKDGIPIFTRVIQLAGSRLTQLISNSIGIPYTAADELKRVYGDVVRDLTQLSLDDIDYKVNAMVQKGVKELGAELKRSFEYFHLQQQNEAEILELVVSGGGSKLKNLFPYLNQELKIKVTPCPLPENIVCPAESLVEFTESWPIYNVALGLALREVTAG
jgi:type IV pilus assembly protein PilM